MNPRSRYEEIADDLAARDPNIELSQMIGMPCVKAGGKMVIGYERNVWTNEKYDKAGITVLPIPGDELGRGRGGARCMSCPLERDGI